MQRLIKRFLGYLDSVNIYIKVKFWFSDMLDLLSNHTISYFMTKQAWKSFSELWTRKKNIRRRKEIFMFKKYIDTTIRSTKTGNRTENRTPDHRKNFMCKWTSMLKEIYLCNFFFGTTIRSAKTGNRTDNRTSDQPEIFMD